MVCKRVICLIYIDIFIFRNININLRFYIWYANVLIAAFTSAYLYPGILTVTSILHTSYKHTYCRIYAGICIFENMYIYLHFLYSM